MAAPCIDLISQIESEIFHFFLRSYQFLCNSAFISHHNSIWLKCRFVENCVSEILHKMNWNCAFEHIHIHSLPPVSNHKLVNAAVPISHPISTSVTAATRSSDNNARFGGVSLGCKILLPAFLFPIPCCWGPWLWAWSAFSQFIGKLKRKALSSTWHLSSVFRGDETSPVTRYCCY